MENLYSNFKESRGIEISEDEFKILILSYPVFKVANADGFFDELERKLLSEILMNFLGEIYREELTYENRLKLVDLFVDDLLFINDHKDIFDAKMLNALKHFPSEVKSSIKDLLLEIAEVSDGIDDSENLVIKELSNNFLSN